MSTREPPSLVPQSPLRFGPDGLLDPDWTWNYAGRERLKAIKQIRKVP